MTQSENLTTDRTDLMQTIQRCAEAYHQVRSQLREGALSWGNDAQENQHKAFLAFAAHLPILCDLASIQVYIACISQGAAIGAIDPADVGRFCHIANTAMAAWKLANLIVPAAQEKERQAQKKEKNEQERLSRRGEKQENPLPPNGNHSQANERLRANPRGEDQAAPLPPNGNHPPTLETLYASSKLPGWEVQKAYFFKLRKRGIEIPADEELHADPAAALHWVETARWYMRGENVPASQAVPAAGAQPSPNPQQLPKQAA